MIDTHCHLLPSIDDGCRNEREALELARRLVAAGVTAVFCTPHFSRRFPTDHALARARLRDLEMRLEETGLSLRLGLAGEVGSAAAVEAAADQLRRRQLGGGFLLVELEPDAPAGVLEIVLERLAELRMTPVFAHPERCRAVRSQPHLLDGARTAGALVQVVSQSLAGRPGTETTRAAWHLLESGRADLLASDAHRPRHADRLRRVLEAVAERIGPQRLIELTQVNPTRFLEAR